MDIQKVEYINDALNKKLKINDLCLSGSHAAVSVDQKFIVICSTSIRGKSSSDRSIYTGESCIYSILHGLQCHLYFNDICDYNNDLDSVKQHYEPLGDFGIVCKDAVRSVLIFCDLPLSAIAKDHLAIYITPHSRTSRKLFQYLYQRRFGIPPVLCDDESSAFTYVYIGNNSLEIAQSSNKYAEVIDLSSWWYQETGYPFVFARWVVRHGLPEADKRVLILWLEESTRIARSPQGRAKMVTKNRKHFVSTLAGLEYYDQIRFRLEDDEQVGLALFLTSMRKMNTCAHIA